MPIPLKSSLERGLPISLSRWTDVAHWYMPWLQDMMVVKGVIPATDPKMLSLSFWKADPDNIHSLFFWTKYPPKLTSALQTWLAPYRVFTAVTITGWEEVETRVPPLEEQLDAFERHLNLVGPELVQWRYSPVPVDFLSGGPAGEARDEKFADICEIMAGMGIKTVDVSLLQPSPHWSQGYSGADISTPEGRKEEEEARQQVFNSLVHIANGEGISVGACADDIRLLEGVPPRIGPLKGQLLEPQVYETRCLDRSKLDAAFGLDTPQIDENGCGCQLSLDPCQGQQFGCASGCEYCYVPFTKIPKK